MPRKALIVGKIRMIRVANRKKITTTLITQDHTYTTSTVLKSHQAGKVTSSPWHGGDTEKSHQVVESHIREEESPWHSLFHPYLEM